MAKLYYEKNGAIYKSESGFPAEQPAKADKIVDRDVLEGHALVYGKKNDAGVMEIRVSETGIPAATDMTITKLQNQADCGTEHTYKDDDKNDKCDICEKAGHTWATEGTVTKAATCVEAGEKTYACTIEGCTATKTEEIPATGEHTYDDDNICTVCGAVKPEETPATPAE